MADENYTLPEVPVYREAIRKILNEDPVNAEEVLNPLVQALLENIAAVKGIADGKVNADLSNVDNADFMNKASEAGAGGIPIAKIRSEDGKNYTAEIPGITELKNGMMIVVIPNKRNLSGGTGSEVTLTINENPELRSRIRMKLYNNFDMYDNLPSAYFSPEVPFTLKYNSVMRLWAVETYWMFADDITGTMPVSKGGTGATTAEEARNNLGIGNAAGKRTARFTVGTSTAGWTADQVDYLCDGTADQVEINAAITALPATGGEVVILDGTYNLAGAILVNKNSVTLSGSGQSTILMRSFSSDDLIKITSKYNIIQSLSIDGMKSVYGEVGNFSIIASGTFNIIKENICYNSNQAIKTTQYSGDNIIIGNTCYDNVTGISLYSSPRSVVTGNLCKGNNGSGITLSGTSFTTVTGNTCYNNGTGIELRDYANTNTVAGNICLRNIGDASDYTSVQYTIYIKNSSNNLIVGNNIMGKNYTNSGTKNTFADNKYTS